MLLVHNVLFVAPWHNAGPSSYIAILMNPRPTINGITRGPADELPPTAVTSGISGSGRLCLGLGLSQTTYYGKDLKEAASNFRSTYSGL